MADGVADRAAALARRSDTMAVRSLQVCSQQVSAGSTPTVLYTVPEGRTLLVKTFTLWNTSLSATGVAFAGQGTAGGISTPMFYVATLAALEVRSGQGWWVIEGGDSLAALVASGGPVGFAAHGSLLLGEVT